jgi:glycosyltransferase involved in cell wall biosynthesis
MHYKIITAVFNAGRFFNRYVESIAEQEHDSYEVVIIDDASTDGTKERALDAAQKHGWYCVANDENRGALYNQVFGIRLLAPKPDDVLVFVDGDDRLAHSKVLQRLDHYYADGVTQLTYGQYDTDP